MSLGVIHKARLHGEGYEDMGQCGQKRTRGRGSIFSVFLRTLFRVTSVSSAVHAFVTSRVDYCNTLLAGAPPKVTTDKLRRVLNAAARVLTGTHKFDRGLSRLLHTELHWLDILERVTYKLGVIMFGCQHGRAPQYLIDYCLPVSDVASRQHLRSASRRILVVPRHRLSTYGRRAIADFFFGCGWPDGLEFFPG